jgi:hypothetical protein
VSLQSGLCHNFKLSDPGEKTPHHAPVNLIEFFRIYDGGSLFHDNVYWSWELLNL